MIGRKGELEQAEAAGALEDEDDDFGHVLARHHPGERRARPAAPLLERDVSCAARIA